MPFDAQQEHNIRRWLVTKGWLRPCLSCGTDDWGLYPEIVMAPNLIGDDDANLDTLDGFGMLIFFCNNCARVTMFTANQILGT
jgi:hypothetical protein